MVLELSCQDRSHRIEGPDVKTRFFAMEIVSSQPFRESRGQLFRELEIRMGEHLSVKDPPRSADPDAGAEEFSSDFELLGNA